MNPGLAALLSAACLAFSATANAELWKWVDEQGQTHYSDSPPPGVKASQVGGSISVIPSPETPPMPAPAPATQASPPAAPPASSTGNAPANASNSAAELKARRTRMIERCEKDRGVDCEESVDALLDGPPPEIYQQPVWIYPYPPRPPIRPHPRPPVKPSPKPDKEEPEMPMLPFPKPVKPK